MATSNHETSTGSARQFELRMLLLLVAGVASWLACSQTVRDTQQMQSELPGLRKAVRELQVRNPDQYAVIQRPEYWVDENRWDVHLPEGSRYRFCFALEAIKGAGVLEPAIGLELQPGIHQVEFIKTMTEDKEMYALRCGDTTAKKERLNIASGNGRSLATGETQCLETKQQATDQPLVLRRHRFSPPDGTTPSYNSSAAGELVWIERVTP